MPNEDSHEKTATLDETANPESHVFGQNLAKAGVIGGTIAWLATNNCIERGN